MFNFNIKKMEPVNKKESEMTPYEKALYYIDNAKTILKEKAIKNDKYYQNPKYVKVAGHLLWSAVLIMLEAVYMLEKKIKLKRGERISFKNYQIQVSKQDSKVSSTLESAYNTLHRSMGYDGHANVKIINDGISEAMYCINWLKNRIPKNSINGVSESKDSENITNYDKDNALG
jgi:hypothetical protein